MRVLVHLSDLHFGKINTDILEPLLRTVHEVRPNLTIVSGDLTHRAKLKQFEQARNFLWELPKPQVIVPGNHDIPFLNLFGRFFRPHHKFLRYISDTLDPYFEDEEIAVFGVNSTKPHTLSEGSITRGQIKTLKEKLAGVSEQKIKVVVTHHPVDVPKGIVGKRLLGAKRLIKIVPECRPDMFLAGHLHVSHITHTGVSYEAHGHQAIITQAGTAMSSWKRKNEPNSFNVIRLHASDISIARHEWRPKEKKFAVTAVDEFVRGHAGWRLVPV